MKAHNDRIYNECDFDKNFLTKCLKNASIEKKTEINIPCHSFVIYILDDEENEMELEQSDLELYHELIEDVLANITYMDKIVHEYYNVSTEHVHTLEIISIKASGNEIHMAYWAKYYNSEFLSIFAKKKETWRMTKINGQIVDIPI